MLGRLSLIILAGEVVASESFWTSNTGCQDRCGLRIGSTETLELPAWRVPRQEAGSHFLKYRANEGLWAGKPLNKQGV
jgi:hypothetical protein